MLHKLLIVLVCAITLSVKSFHGHGFLKQKPWSSAVFSERREWGGGGSSGAGAGAGRPSYSPRPPSYGGSGGGGGGGGYGGSSYGGGGGGGRFGGGGRGGGGGGRGGGGYGGGGGRFRGRGAASDPFEKLRFRETIKIDPDLKTPISEMSFSDKTLRVLQEKGFTECTPVQSQSYARVLAGEDVVARSRTGTGKTLAFGLPLIERLVSQGLNEARQGLPLILILEPTRELAMQVAQELGSICAAHRMRVQAVYGGVSFQMQARAIRSGVHILVATPGRALDHISRGTVDLSSVQHVVLDEGDTMLEMGFQKDVESIILNVKKPGAESRRVAASSLNDEDEPEQQSRSWSPQGGYNDGQDEDAEDDLDEDDLLDDERPKILGDDDDDDDDDMDSNSGGNRNVQMLLFSATMPGWICKLTDKHMSEPIFLDAVQEGETRLASTITHLAVRLPPIYDRFEAVSAYVEDIILTKGAGGQTIVFTNTKDEADRLISSDCLGSLRTQVLHGDISQNTRQTTIKALKDGLIDVLVATDVAARGLDIAGIDLVLHTGAPMDHDTYVHRSGRTGRAGRNGTSVILYSTNEEGKLRMYENNLNFKFIKAGPPTVAEISEASAHYASKRLERISDDVVKHFMPHARSLIQEAIHADGLGRPSPEAGQEVVEGGSDRVEQLLARCMAAISNRQKITSRSLLTGEADLMTIQVDAVFKNGSQPATVQDWQKLVAGVLRRSLEIEDVKFSKTALARTAERQLVCLVDMPYERAASIIAMLSSTPLPQGVSIKQCQVLPMLIPDRDSRGDDRRGGGSYRGGGGGGGGYRGGNDRPRSYGGGGGGGGGGGRVYTPRNAGGNAVPGGNRERW